MLTAVVNNLLTLKYIHSEVGIGDLPGVWNTRRAIVSAFASYHLCSDDFDFGAPLVRTYEGRKGVRCCIFQYL